MSERQHTPWRVRLTGIAAWVSVVALWLCAASGYISPEHFPWLGVVSLAFPFFLLGVAVMLPVCLLVSRRRAWIPLLGLCVAFPAIRTYCPVNFSADPPKGAIKLVTYNTCWTGGTARDADGRLTVARYLADLRADIICLQEAGITPPHLYDTELRPVIQASGTTHFDTVNTTDNIFAIYSRYPIAGKEIICHHGTNGAVAFHLVFAPGDTVTVVNCHLESMRLSQDDRDIYRHIVHNEDSADFENGSRMLVSKISRAAALRAAQADSVARYVERHAGRSLLLCGDFNDSPLSYTRHRIARHLTDAYRATGNGPGRTFNRDAIVVRIDHMMCSDDWTPYACHVDTSCRASDHYPVVGWFEKK